MKKKLIISFSGGRTSAYMLWWLMNEWEDRHNWEIIVVFSNTGKEVEGTLFFVDECSQEWNIPIVWVEGYPSDKGKGWEVNHKVVTYETASRKGEPFEAMISRLGIPNANTTPFCSPQLKREAILDYAHSLGWDDFHVAIGVRYDEPARVNRDSKKQKILFPLVDLNPKNKIEIMIWWSHQSFDLKIHPDEGNCDNCLKKGYPILVRNMIRKPNSFNWWEQMTEKYGYLNPRDTDLEPPFNFYRGNKSVFDIKELAKLSQAELKQLSLFDTLDGCSESCEAF